MSTTELDSQGPVAPFVKWAGGKRGVMPHIAKHFPDEIGTYWEPFVGGGAVFFAMVNRINRAILSDANEELVIAYKMVKSKVNVLIDELKKHEYNHHADDGYFLKIRGEEPESEIDIAARFIYLNKTCFNGLYRVNKSGKFNVPQGSYKKPTICNEDGLKRASNALRKASIKVGGFDEVVKPAAGDFIYCDPPYDECFTDYQPGGFKSNDQERLRNKIDTWVKSGAAVMASNSDTPLIRQMYMAGGGV